MLLQKPARRLLIRASGRLEVCLIDMAEKIASKHGDCEVASEHMQLAIQSLANDNAAFRESIASAEGARHVGRLAG